MVPPHVEMPPRCQLLVPVKHGFVSINSGRWIAHHSFPRDAFNYNHEHGLPMFLVQALDRKKKEKKMCGFIKSESATAIFISVQRKLPPSSQPVRNATKENLSFVSERCFNFNPTMNKKKHTQICSFYPEFCLCVINYRWLLFEHTVCHQTLQLANKTHSSALFFFRTQECKSPLL